MSPPDPVSLLRKPSMPDEQLGSQHEEPREEGTQTKYLFVHMNMKGGSGNHPVRRSHVMHNNHKHAKPRETSAENSGDQDATPLILAQKNFRLSRAGLEQRPLRGSKRKPVQIMTSQAKDAPSSSTLPNLADESSNQDPYQLQLTSTRTLDLEDARSVIRFSTSPLLVFGISRIDPFGVLPIKLSAPDENLLNRFCLYEKWPWCPVNGQSAWGPFALSDELVFSATMYTWSMGIRSRLAGKFDSLWLQDNPGVARHGASAISLINARLMAPSQAVTDETIAAVAAVTNLELLFGVRDTANKHMDGLKTLVAMRGGISTFATDVQLLIWRLICWSDMVYSELFSTPLVFPPSEIWGPSWTSRDELSLPGSPIGLSPFELRDVGIGHHEVIDLLHETRKLCEVEQTKPLKMANDRDRMERGDLFLRIEGRLRVIEQSISTDNLHQNAITWKATSLALLIFIHHFLRGSSLKLRTFQFLVPTLQETLSHMKDTLEELAFARSLLFWVLAVGASTSVEMSCNDWFIRTLSDASKRYSMGWVEFRSLLMGFLWIGSADEQRYLEVWHRVQQNNV